MYECIPHTLLFDEDILVLSLQHLFVQVRYTQKKHDLDKIQTHDNLGQGPINSVKKINAYSEPMRAKILFK